MLQESTCSRIVNRFSFQSPRLEAYVVPLEMKHPHLAKRSRRYVWSKTASPVRGDDDVLRRRSTLYGSPPEGARGRVTLWHLKALEGLNGRVGFSICVRGERKMRSRSVDMPVFGLLHLHVLALKTKWAHRVAYWHAR
jgi:hypothetical protein